MYVHRLIHLGFFTSHLTSKKCLPYVYDKTLRIDPLICYKLITYYSCTPHYQTKSRSASFCRTTQTIVLRHFTIATWAKFTVGVCLWLKTARKPKTLHTTSFWKLSVNSTHFRSGPVFRPGFTPLPLITAQTNCARQIASTLFPWMKHPNLNFLNLRIHEYTRSRFSWSNARWMAWRRKRKHCWS